jgi:uncharacterized protein (TIGR02284 family)
MSTDRKVTKKLMETLEDGRLGYEKAAERLADEHADLASSLSSAAKARAEMYAELQRKASTYGDDLEESGSVVATLHRGWLALKDALTGDSAEAVLKAAITGENHSIEQYEEALSSEDLSEEFRPQLQRHLVKLKGDLSELERLTAGVKAS